MTGCSRNVRSAERPKSMRKRPARELKGYVFTSVYGSPRCSRSLLKKCESQAKGSYLIVCEASCAVPTGLFRGLVRAAVTDPLRLLKIQWPFVPRSALGASGVERGFINSL